MTFRIRKGKHRAWPLHFGLFYKKRVMARTVLFTDSCRVDVGVDDLDDTNKLYGIGYFWGHHIDSARFGWWYNPATDKIAISAYCWVNKQPVYLYDVCEVELNTCYNLSLRVSSGYYDFSVYSGGVDKEHQIGEAHIPFSHHKRWSFPLGVYFGGNQPAPHDIEIKLSK